MTTFAPNFRFNELEQNIIDLVNATSSFIYQKTGKKITTRIAGGYVRDRLLNKESDDIDIAVDQISGLDFARYLEQYAKLNNIQDVSNVYEVSLEKSADGKPVDANNSLKVGGIKVFGQKIEFVSLRTETYSQESRKPVATSTNNVLDDVIRRDLTINAMYYNTQTNMVEDYVNGLDDLKTMTLRTPADPNKTFNDDPLRMLRVLRFYSRFQNATIDPKILEVLKQSADPNSEFSKNYMQKVHPSRASKELRKLMGGKNPIAATRLLLETGFYKLVFRTPDNWMPISMDQQNPHHNMSLMDHILGVMDNINKVTARVNQNIQQNAPDKKDLIVSPQEKSLLLISAMLHDFGKMSPEIRQPKPNSFVDRNGEQVPHMRYIGHEKESASFAEKILTDMGFEPQEKTFIHSVVKNRMRVHDKMDNKQMGKFLYEATKYYRHIMYHGIADTLSKQNITPEQTENMYQDRTQKLDNLEQYKQELGERVFKPLLNGDEIKEIVQKEAPEVANTNAMLLLSKDDKKPTHYLKYLTKRLLEAQWAKKINTRDEALLFISKELKQFIGGLTQQDNEKKKQNNSNMNKKASTEHFALESRYNLLDRYNEQGDEQRIVNYFSISPFKPGDKVKLRMNNGVNMRMTVNIIGRVVSQHNEQMVVQWESGVYQGKDVKGKISKYNLGDPLTVSLMLEKVR